MERCVLLIALGMQIRFQVDQCFDQVIMATARGHMERRETFASSYVDVCF